ncbi:MAG TPA: MFS transporter [Chromatiales bacterium]|nr:MFS transporter [Chromatiales bacterium]
MTAGLRPGIDTSAARLGPFWLSPGISRGNALTLFFSGFSLICLFTFMSFVQPYLLQEVLHIPKDQQGSLTGLLGVVHEVVVLSLVSLIGGSSDRFGRRVVYVTGVCLLAAGFALYPMAETPMQLIAFRVFYAVGFAASSVMLHTCLAEYPQNAVRGRWMGTAAVLNALGVTVMAFALSRLPAWYVGLGFDEVLAARLSFWTFSGYLLALAVLLRVGLAPGTEHVNRRESLLKIVSRGFVAARDNPRIRLSYAMAFASRGDLVVLTVYFSLWVVQAGHDQGMTAAEATAKAGMLFGLSQAAGLLWSYPIGVIIDRINRLTGMCIAFGLATAGYFALGLIGDPFGKVMLAACLLVGMGESSVMVAGGTMVGQEAPAESRGAVLGTFSLMGALGMMLLTFTGGIIFDQIGRTSPFLMMGAVNGLVLLAALGLRRSERIAASRLAAESAVQASTQPDSSS